MGLTLPAQVSLSFGGPGWDAEGPDDQPPLLPLHHRNFGQMTHLMEPQALIDPPGGLVVVEVHAQERRHPQARTLLNHPLLELAADPAAETKAWRMRWKALAQES